MGHLDFARAMGRLGHLSLTAWRHGAMPLVPAAVGVARREGLGDLHWKAAGDTLVRFLRSAGPVPTKLGQILAGRSDLLPAAVCARLEALYEGQPAMPRRKLQKILARAYRGKFPFASIEPVPMGVGSVGQVHRARLMDGRTVIVKVLRPDVQRQVRRDMMTLRMLVRSLARLPRGVYAPLLLRSLDDLEAAFLTETDLRNEAQALVDFRRRLRRNKRVYVPECHRDLSTSEVLVMEEVIGEPLSRYRARAERDPTLVRGVAELALREVLRQVFEDGRFHGDPHAGNLFVMPDGRLALIDLGLTGEFRPEQRQAIARAVKALQARDPDAVMRALLSFGVVPDGFDQAAFQQEIAATVRRHRVAALAHVQGTGEGPGALETMMNDLFRVAFAHRIYLPSQTTLLIKTLVTIEGVARSLDPRINVAKAAAPVILRALAPRWLRRRRAD